MKTLDDVEPRIIVNGSNTPGDANSVFIISLPGSYYLTGNLTGTPGLDGIRIQANDVTLDLNGFALIGSGSGRNGVNVPNAQSGFHIHSGSVTGWTTGGVSAKGAVTLAERLRLSGNVGGIGLFVGNGSIVKDCVASGNYRGFDLPDRTQISGCIATVNQGEGFACSDFVSIIDCTASRNGGSGIFTGGSCSIIRCTATRNAQGITAATACTIADCTVSSNVSEGITTGSGCAIRNCTANFNAGNGISIQGEIEGEPGRCHITGNTCDSNTGNGIETFVSMFNHLEGNSSSSNAIGFSVLRSSNLIIRNSASFNREVGFSVPGDGNLIICNTAVRNGPTGTENYSVSFTNAMGPFIDFGNQDSPWENPWANFIF